MKVSYKLFALFTMMFSSLYASAEGTPSLAADAQATSSSLISFDVNTVLAVCVAALLFVIILLAFLLKSSIDLYRDNYKQTKKSNASKTALVMVGLLLSASAFAQEGGVPADLVAAPVTAAQFNSSMISTILIVAIAIELFIIFYLIKWVKFFSGIQAFEERRRIAMGEDPELIERGGFKAWWNRVNKFRALREEGELELEHAYDGIKELDNTTPPWFTWSFIGSIIFAIGYIWYYNSSSAMTQEEELQKEVAIANKRIEAYMATQANSVDENTVEMLDAAGIQAGAQVYKSKCVACHGDKGQGGIGPNFTDRYYLHGGSIKEIFHTIKYGVVEKGMQAWKTDLSPMQIAQVASYVKSLEGTDVPGGKAPQGVLDQADAKDRASQTDSTKTEGQKVGGVATNKQA